MDKLRGLILFSFLCFAFLAGCDNNGSNDDPVHGILLGTHSPEAVEDLRTELDVDEPMGEPHHIHIDGDNLADLTDEDKALLQDSFDQGFIISLYNMNEGRIQEFYRDILMDPDIHAEPDNADLPDGQDLTAFNIEQINGVYWSSISQFETFDQSDAVPLSEIAVAVEDGPVLNPQEAYAQHTRMWIEEQEDRRLRINDDGFISDNVKDNFEQLLNQKVTASGNLVGNIPFIAKTWVQTNSLNVDIADDNFILIINDCNGCDNSYSIETQAWMVTTPEPDSYLFVIQNLDLNSSGGIFYNSANKIGWYLSSFEITNTYTTNEGLLASDVAELLDNQPGNGNIDGTGEAGFILSQNVSGTQRYDTTDGSSTTGSNLAIEIDGMFNINTVKLENLSKTQVGSPVDDSPLGNDASWLYTQDDPVLEGCDLEILPATSGSIGEINPGNAFVVKFSPGSPGETLTLNTSAKVILHMTTQSDPGGDPADCMAITDKVTIPANGPAHMFPQAIHIPDVP